MMVCGDFFLGSTKVSEAPGDGPGCLQFFCDSSSDASWALWAWGELVIFSLVLDPNLGVCGSGWRDEDALHEGA